MVWSGVVGTQGDTLLGFTMPGTSGQYGYAIVTAGSLHTFGTVTGATDTDTFAVGNAKFLLIKADGGAAVGMHTDDDGLPFFAVAATTNGGPQDELSDTTTGSGSMPDTLVHDSALATAGSLLVVHAINIEQDASFPVFDTGTAVDFEASAVGSGTARVFGRADVQSDAVASYSADFMSAAGTPTYESDWLVLAIGDTPPPISPDWQPLYEKRHATVHELPHYLDTGLLRGL